MTPTPPDRSKALAADGSPDSPAGDRLDSWKEIAAFLQRDVRTVQRWEKHAGLPVHRHAEARLRTAFAYRSELEAWWRAQPPVMPDDASANNLAATSADEVSDTISATPVTPRPGLGRRATAIGAGAALLGVLFAVVAIVRSIDRSTAAVTTGPPVSVLLTRFDDQAGEPGLAGMVEEIVARELQRHSALEPIAPARIRRTLRLMRRDTETALTAAIGRELAIRDGQVRFVVAGKVHKLHSRYFVDLEAIGPGDGRVSVTVEPNGDTPTALLASVADESARFAAALVEAGRKEVMPEEKLEPMTTGSLPALRLYSAAVQAGHRRQWRASELLARRAVAADPEFAAAHAWAAWAMRQQGQPAAACAEGSSRGIELSRGASDRETYFIAAIHHAITGDLPAAIAAHEALRGLYPTDRLALDMLITEYSRAGRMKDAVALSVLRAETDPRDFYANVRATHALIVWQTDPKRALPFLTRAQELASHTSDEDRSAWAAWLTGLPVFEQWLAGENGKALATLDGLQKSLDGRLGRERDAYATMVGFSYLVFGQIGESTRALRHAASPVRQLNLAMQALALGDGSEPEARRWLLQVRQHSTVRPALFARAGLVEDAEIGLAGLPPSGHAEGVTEVTRGLIASRRRQIDTAIPLLRRGMELLRFSGEIEYFFAVEALARIRMQAGDTPRAIQLLSETVAQRARTYGATPWAGAYWLKLQQTLTEHHRQRGETAEAQRLQAEMDAVLRSADAGHPFRSPATSTARMR
jgi:hypothetical protein